MPDSFDVKQVITQECESTSQEKVFNAETGEVNLSGMTLEEVDSFFKGFESTFISLDLSGSDVTFEWLKKNANKFSFITELDVRNTNLSDNAYLFELPNLRKLKLSGFFPFHFYNNENHGSFFSSLEEVYCENHLKNDPVSIPGVKGLGKKLILCDYYVQELGYFHDTQVLEINNCIVENVDGFAGNNLESVLLHSVELNFSKGEDAIQFLVECGSSLDSNSEFAMKCNEEFNFMFDKGGLQHTECNEYKYVHGEFKSYGESTKIDPAGLTIDGKFKCDNHEQLYILTMLINSIKASEYFGIEDFDLDAMNSTILEVNDSIIFGDTDIIDLWYLIPDKNKRKEFVNYLNEMGN